MKTKTVWALLLLCLTMRVSDAAPGSLRAATQAQRETFRALYAKNDVAATRGDARYLNGILAPDFKSRSLKGRTSNRTQRVRNVTNLFRSIKVDSAKTTIERLGFQGKQAVAVVLAAVEFRMRGADGETHRVSLLVRSTDTWISTSRGWLLQSTIDNQGRQFVDGREVAVG